MLTRAAGQFDAFVTVDRNLAFQQRIDTLPFAVVVLRAGQIDWPISGRLFRCYYRCCQLFSLGRSNGSSMRRSGGASRSPTCHLSARRSVGLRSSARPTRLAAVRIKTLPGRRDSNGVTATAKLIRDTTCGTRGTCPSCGACRRLQFVTNLARTCLPVRCQLHYQPQRNQL